MTPAIGAQHAIAAGPLTLSFNQAARLAMEHGGRMLGRPVPPMHLPLTLRFRGNLDLSSLRTALSALAGRHEAFRTALRPDTRSATSHDLDRVPVVDHGEPSVGVEERVLSEARWQEWIEATEAGTDPFLTRPFDYGRPPLARARLLTLGIDHHVLTLLLHHLVCDGQSMQVLKRELLTIYAAVVAGRAAPLPAAGGRYVEFAAWQRHQLASGALAPAMLFWRRRWAEWQADLVHVRELGGDPNATGERVAAASIAVGLEASLVEGVRALARMQRVTLYSVYLAALGAALCALTGRQRVAVWAQFANRLHARWDNVVGWFANPQLLAFETAPADPLVSVRRAHSAVVDAAGHQQLPIHALLPQFLQASRTTVHPALDPARIQFGVRTVTPCVVAGVEVAQVLHRMAPTSLALCVEAIDTGAGTFLNARCAPAAVNRVGAERLLWRMRDVLAIWVDADDPRRPATRCLDRDRQARSSSQEDR